MPSSFTTAITYFLQEGRENLPECLKITFQAAKQQRIGKVIIFTAEGAGISLAIEQFCVQPEYQDIELIAVTFPQGKEFTAEGNPLEVRIPDTVESEMRNRNIPIVRAHLPFDPIAPRFKDRGVLAQDLSLVGSALSVFGGSMSLCVQAVALACDAGVVKMGEHVIAMTSDTAILVQASTTRRMLRELIVREILCKPAILTIGKNERQIDSHLPEEIGGPGNESAAIEGESPKLLP